jgi:hypothetical protein
MENRRQQAAREREERYQNILRKRIVNSVFRKRRKNRRSRSISVNSSDSEISNLGEAFQNLFCNPDSSRVEPNMAAQANLANFDPQDAIFNRLDPAIQAHLNNILARNVAAAAPIVYEHRMTNTNINIEVPVYNHKTMTSDTFLKKCRTYLTAQGHAPAQFHELLPMILKGEFKLWFDSVCGNINSWDDFKEAFKRRYDNDSIQRSRQRLLHTRRQGSNDPTEQFVFEMVNLARQIDPLEEDEISLKRARDALLPDIAALVGDCNPWTIDNLLERCSSAHELLNRQSRIKEKKPADIPPLKGLRENIEKRDSSRNGNDRGNRNDSFRGNHNQNNGRGSFRGNGRGMYNNRGNHNQNYYNPNQGNSNREDNDRNRNNGRSFRGNDRGRGNGNRQTDMSKVKCHKCQRFGHFARDCRSENVILAMPHGRATNSDPPLNYVQISHHIPQSQLEETQQSSAPPYHNPYNHQETVPIYSNVPTHQNPLNSRGRNPGSSDRGYSQL